jgi:hypothetical protein
MILDAQEDIEVVGEAADGLEAIAKAHELGAVALPPKRDSGGSPMTISRAVVQPTSRRFTQEEGSARDFRRLLPSNAVSNSTSTVKTWSSSSGRK